MFFLHLWQDRALVDLSKNAYLLSVRVMSQQMVSNVLMMRQIFLVISILHVFDVPIKQAVLALRSVNGIVQRTSLSTVLLEMNVSQMPMIVVVISARRCVAVGSVSHEMLHVQLPVISSVIMMVSVVIMNHVTVVIVSTETVMITTTVKPKLVYDAHEMSLNLHVMKPPVVQLVWVGIVLRIVA